MDSEQQKDFINNNYLTNSGSEFPDKIKLKQVTKDWDSYRALIKGEEAQPGIIKNAYDTFKKLIEDKKIANPEITPENYILAIRRMNVAVIFLDERPFKGEDPQIIFETLNSLGKPLTLSDLIRNYVLLNMNSKDQTIAYERIWYPQIEKPLAEDTSSFFRDFLQYKTSSSIKAVSDDNTKVAVDFRNPKITIEHVMPQTLSPAWEKSLGEDFENIHVKYLHNIGNLILTEFNSEIGNDSFDAKKKKLATSSLFYRLDVVNAGSWGEAEIKSHQAKMIQWFLETFPLPEQSKHTSNWNTKLLEVTSFSPLDNEAGAMAEGNKPSVLKLGDKEIKVSNLKDVYLEFLRFIKDSGSYDFQIVLDNQAELLGREDAIIPWSSFEKKVEADSNMRGKYNSIDGLPWDKVVNLTSGTLFYHVNFNAHRTDKQGCQRHEQVLHSGGLCEHNAEMTDLPFRGNLVC